MGFRAVHHNQRVMVVDDDIDMRLMLTIILEREDIDVIAAGNGQEALDLMDKGEVPDLILTDMTMPGMGGSELFAKIKNNLRTKDVPVLIVSGLDDLAVTTKSLGAQGFLKKPYTLSTLTTFIKNHLH